MSEGRSRAGVAAAGALAGVLLAGGPLYASHFAWLGHGPCPWQEPQCEEQAPTGFTALGQFVPTSHRMLDEASSEWAKGTPSEPLLSREGRVIARVSPAFKAKLDEEGSARLRDGRVVNLDEPVDGRPRYLVVRNAPFGIGAPGYKLIPYRTVAVDPKRIELGTVLYVPALAGIKLPTGEIHDGFCFAHDTSTSVAENEIDIFIGFDEETAGALSHLLGGNAVRVYRVDPDTAAVLNRRFKRQFDFSG